MSEALAAPRPATFDPRSLIADLPDLTGTPARTPEGFRAQLLQEDLERAAAATQTLREFLLDLMAPLHDAGRTDLVDGIRSVLLRTL